MLEEIKRLPVYKEYMQNINGAHWDLETISRKKVLEILDKYNNQEDYLIVDRKECYCMERIYAEQYKKAWEELKNDNTELIEYGNRAVKEPKRYKNRKMYLLEQKYNLGSETNERTN